MSWLTVVAKIAPHVASVAHAVVPVFTQRGGNAPLAVQSGELRRQIAELQAAASQNAENIRKLAGDLQSALAALDRAGRGVDAGRRRLEVFVYVTLGLSVAACLATAALWSR